MSCRPCKVERISERHAAWLAGKRADWDRAVDDFFSDVAAARTNADYHVRKALRLAHPEVEQDYPCYSLRHSAGGEKCAAMIGRGVWPHWLGERP